MNIVSLIKVVIQASGLLQRNIEFFVYRLSISLVKCHEYVEDSFDGRTLKDIDFSKAPPSSYSKIFNWQRNLIKLDKVLALWAMERKNRFTKNVEAVSTQLSTFALRAQATALDGRDRGSIF